MERVKSVKCAWRKERRVRRLTNRMRGEVTRGRLCAMMSRGEKKERGGEGFYAAVLASFFFNDCRLVVEDQQWEDY